MRFVSAEAGVHRSDDSEKHRDLGKLQEIPPAGTEERTTSHGVTTARLVSGRQHELVVRAGVGWKSGL